MSSGHLTIKRIVNGEVIDVIEKDNIILNQFDTMFTSLKQIYDIDWYFHLGVNRTENVNKTDTDLNTPLIKLKVKSKSFDKYYVRLQGSFTNINGKITEFGAGLEDKLYTKLFLTGYSIFARNNERFDITYDLKFNNTPRYTYTQKLDVQPERYLKSGIISKNTTSNIVKAHLPCTLEDYVKLDLENLENSDISKVYNTEYAYEFGETLSFILKNTLTNPGREFTNYTLDTKEKIILQHKTLLDRLQTEKKLYLWIFPNVDVPDILKIELKHKILENNVLWLKTSYLDFPLKYDEEGFRMECLWSKKIHKDYYYHQNSDINLQPAYFGIGTETEVISKLENPIPTVKTFGYFNYILSIPEATTENLTPVVTENFIKSNFFNHAICKTKSGFTDTFGFQHISKRTQNKIVINNSTYAYFSNLTKQPAVAYNQKIYYVSSFPRTINNIEFIYEDGKVKSKDNSIILIPFDYANEVVKSWDTLEFENRISNWQFIVFENYFGDYNFLDKEKIYAADYVKIGNTYYLIRNDLFNINKDEILDYDEWSTFPVVNLEYIIKDNKKYVSYKRKELLTENVFGFYLDGVETPKYKFYYNKKIHENPPETLDEETFKNQDNDLPKFFYYDGNFYNYEFEQLSLVNNLLFNFNDFKQLLDSDKEFYLDFFFSRDTDFDTLNLTDHGDFGLEKGDTTYIFRNKVKIPKESITYTDSKISLNLDIDVYSEQGVLKSVLLVCPSAEKPVICKFYFNTAPSQNNVKNIEIEIHKELHNYKIADDNEILEIENSTPIYKTYGILTEESPIKLDDYLFEVYCRATHSSGYYNSIYSYQKKLFIIWLYHKLKNVEFTALYTLPKFEEFWEFYQYFKFKNGDGPEVTETADFLKAYNYILFYDYCEKGGVPAEYTGTTHNKTYIKYNPYVLNTGIKKKYHEMVMMNDFPDLITYQYENTSNNYKEILVYPRDIEFIEYSTFNNYKIESNYDDRSYGMTIVNNGVVNDKYIITQRQINFTEKNSKKLLDELGYIEGNYLVTFIHNRNYGITNLTETSTNVIYTFTKEIIKFEGKEAEAITILGYVQDPSNYDFEIEEMCKNKSLSNQNRIYGIKCYNSEKASNAVIYTLVNFDTDFNKDFYTIQSSNNNYTHVYRFSNFAQGYFNKPIYNMCVGLLQNYVYYRNGLLDET